MPLRLYDLGVDLCVPLPNAICLARLLQLVAGVFADRLEHVEARLTVRVVPPDEQILLDERLDQIERAVANGLDHVESGTAGEHGEPREEPLLVWLEQLVAPVDRRSKRLLAVGNVTRASGQQIEPLVQPG